MSGFALAAGWAADIAFGDPRRLHPVAGFGRAALALERAIYAPSRGRGALFAAVLVGGAAAAGQLATRLAERVAGRAGRTVVLAVVTWGALGGRSLVREGRRIAELLEAGDLDGARDALPALAGRDPSQLDESGISRAVVESLAENSSDAVVGALVWGAAAGPAGIAAFRAANTLDAMVGHRSPRYERFGFAAAKLDDAMGWPGARLGALLAVALAPIASGSPRAAWRILRRDGAAHPSPNAGRMEAAFAGALDLRLGGPLRYGERTEHRPTLGDGRPPQPADAARAARLSLAVGAASALLCAAARAAAPARARRATGAVPPHRDDSTPTIDGSGR
ncbi:cobalamin biosynthesis protein [Conexibacter arvalis]|uniref:Cobalamin biosynthesis protein CobD n=1 Tax=Conexibacter arvalis TaxID=912552 RepID=A0A840IML6_9ACTN|nr:adenosylcobinamide-phosphate synthase [Conexibacter arvalis]